MGTMELHWWYWDISGHCLHISPHLRQLLGYSESEFDGKVPTIEKNIHPEDIASNQQLFYQLIGGEIDIYEKEYRIRIGEKWQWFYNRGTITQRDEQGKPAIIGGISMQMSQRYRHMLSRVEEGRKFEFIFENTHESMLVFEFKAGYDTRRVVDANRAAGILFGCDYRELVGVDPLLFASEGLKQSGETFYNRVVEQGSIRFETDVINLKKEQRHLVVHAHLFSMTGQRLILAVLTDMTDSMKTRRELEQSEIRFRSVFDNTLHGILLLDRDGHITHSNPRAVSMFHAIERHVEQTALSDLLYMEASQLGTYLMALREGREDHVIFETRVEQPANDPFWLQVSLSMVKKKTGEVDYFVAMLDDISGRKRMEHELRDSENMYRTLIHSADDRIGVFDMEGNIVLTNAAFHEALGYTGEEYREVQNRENIHPEDMDYLKEKTRELLEKGSSSTEYRVQHKEGHYLHMSSKSVVLPGSDHERSE